MWRFSNVPKRATFKKRGLVLFSNLLCLLSSQLATAIFPADLCLPCSTILEQVEGLFFFSFSFISFAWLPPPLHRWGPFTLITHPTLSSLKVLSLPSYKKSNQKNRSKTQLLCMESRFGNRGGLEQKSIEGKGFAIIFLLWLLPCCFSSCRIPGKRLHCKHKFEIPLVGKREVVRNYQIWLVGQPCFVFEDYAFECFRWWLWLLKS